MLEYSEPGSFPSCIGDGRVPLVNPFALPDPAMPVEPDGDVDTLALEPAPIDAMPAKVAEFLPLVAALARCGCPTTCSLASSDPTLFDLPNPHWDQISGECEWCQRRPGLAT